MASRYDVCNNIPRRKPDITVDEEVEKAIGQNYRTLPTFEKGLHEFAYKKLYSLENNEFLRCHWNEYKGTIENRTFAPFQFFDIRDYHFYNQMNRIIPTESIYKKGNYRKTLKPGPGVDAIGEIPIPQELIMKRQKPKLKPQKSIVNVVPHKKNIINSLNSHLT